MQIGRYSGGFVGVLGGVGRTVFYFFVFFFSFAFFVSLFFFFFIFSFFSFLFFCLREGQERKRCHAALDKICLAEKAKLITRVLLAGAGRYQIPTRRACEGANLRRPVYFTPAGADLLRARLMAFMTSTWWLPPHADTLRGP